MRRRGRGACPCWFRARARKRKRNGCARMQNWTDRAGRLQVMMIGRVSGRASGRGGGRQKKEREERERGQSPVGAASASPTHPARALNHNTRAHNTQRPHSSTHTPHSSSAARALKANPRSLFAPVLSTTAHKTLRSARASPLLLGTLSSNNPPLGRWSPPRARAAPSDRPRSLRQRNARFPGPIASKPPPPAGGLSIRRRRRRRQ